MIYFPPPFSLNLNSPIWISTMLTKSRLILSSLLFSVLLIACSDSSESTTAMSIDTGMSEQTISEKLGIPTFTQSRTLGELTFTQSEWTTETGTTSVQFHNGVAQFSQFIPAANED